MDSLSRIYFVGVCGTAMGNVAVVFSRMGYVVAGSDVGVYPPMSTVLAASGVQTCEGFDVGDLQKFAPDLVVLGNAVSRGNAQLEYLLEFREYPMLSLPEVVGRLLLKKRRRLVLAGTHGKTTTTAAAAFILERLRCEPGYLIGGVPCDLPGGAAPGGEDSPFVIEGDEYDSAIFDKRSKFQHYFPHVFVIGNMEFDHGDIFHDWADYRRTFLHAIRLLPRNGFLLINGDDAPLVELASQALCTVLTVGMGDGNDFVVRGLSEAADGMAFEVYEAATGCASKLESPLNGEFNARNVTMAALGTACLLGERQRWGQHLAALRDFRGVKRRMELRAKGEGVAVYEDFGHHPTAVDSSLKSLRQRYPEASIWAVFEPRSNTAVTHRFQKEFARAFARADRLDVAPLYRAERMGVEARLDVRALVAGVGIGRAWENWEAMEAGFVECLARADKPLVIVFFSNGSFRGLIDRVTIALSS